MADASLRLSNAVPLIVMGVSGCGKSTVAAALAKRLRRPFLDADDFHPSANREKMREGVALTDADRGPWLATLNDMLRARPNAVLACSALRRAYRRRLAAGLDHLDVVYLHAEHDVLLERMQERPHFMPPSLLRSQLDTLEAPTAEEALVLDAALPVDQVVEAVIASRR